MQNRAISIIMRVFSRAFRGKNTNRKNKHMIAQPPAAEHHAPLTIVTAFFALDETNAPRPDGRTSRDYRRWMANFLPAINWPLVVFCDEQSAGVIKRLRGDKPAVYHITRLEEFSVYRHRRELRAHIAQRWPGFPADASLIYHEKANFVRRAMDENPYQSEMFFWCDIGVFRQPKARAVFQPSARIEWPNLDVCRGFGERVAFFAAADDAARKRGRSWALGTIWGGRAAPVRRFCDNYYRCLSLRMRANPAAPGRAVPKGLGYQSDEAIFNSMSAGDFNMHVFTTDDIPWLRGLERLAKCMWPAPDTRAAASNPIVAPPPPRRIEKLSRYLHVALLRAQVLLPERRAVSVGVSRPGNLHGGHNPLGGKNHPPASRIVAA